MLATRTPSRRFLSLRSTLPSRDRLSLEWLEHRLLLASDLSLEVIHGPTGDLSFIESGLPTEPDYPAELAPVDLSEDVEGLGESADPVSGPQDAPAQGLNFTATTFPQSGFIPPDTHGAVGPNHIVELINGSYAVFDKDDGSELDRSSLNQFWTDSGISPNGAFDPRVAYDRSISRFYAVAVNNARADNEFLFAISQSNDPTDGWIGFAVDTDSDNGQRWADYPQLSFDDESIHIGVNMFDIPGGTDFSATRTTLVISKADLLDGFPDISDRTLIEDHQNTTGFSAQGVVYNPDNTGGLPSVFFSQFNDNTVRLSQLNGPPTAATFTVWMDLNLSSTSPPNADQADSSKQDLDTGSNRFSSQVVWRNGSYWAVQGVESGGDATIRFLEVSSGGAVNQNMTFGTSGDLDLFYPSIAVNSANDVVIGFSFSSSSHNPSAGYFSGSTTGGVTSFQTNPFAVPAFGSAGYERIDSNGRNRWGDYSHTVVDPSDDTTFWTFQEFASSEDVWATRVTEIRPRSPELTGTSFNVVTEPLSPGDTVDIDYSVINNGDGDAGSFWVDFFLSTNTTISTADFLLGFQFYGSLAAGASTGVVTETVTLPDLDDPFWDGFNSDGIYTIGMIVDRFDDQLESNESNNSNVAEFTDYDTLAITLPVPATLLAPEGFAYFQHTGSSDEALSFDAFLDFAGDIDSFVFAGDTGWSGAYTITAGDFGNAVDPVVAVYDAATGNMVAIADDLSDTIDDSELIVNLNGRQRYIVAVVDKENDTTGDVSITITAPNSSFPQTIPVDGSGDGATSTLIDDNADTDFFSFTAPANATGSLNVDVVGGANLESAISLYDPFGTELASDLFSVLGGTASVAIGGVVPGDTFYLSVLPEMYNSADGFDVFVDFSTLALLGDFDNDGAYTCNDVDMLVLEIATGGADLTFDIDPNGMIDQGDLDVWLAEAAAFDGFGSPYKRGDANLDGVVDGADFVIWNNNKFLATGAWCRADFNADGNTNGQDFVIWNTNKFTASDAIVVPGTLTSFVESDTEAGPPPVAPTFVPDGEELADLDTVVPLPARAVESRFDLYAFEPESDDTEVGDPLQNELFEQAVDALFSADVA